LQLFRYADVYLMIAEAYLRQSQSAPALVQVNLLRVARKAAPLLTLTLVNANNLYDGTTMLSERQKKCIGKAGEEKT
jgi:N-glycosylase/DNA lyase